MGSFRNQHVFFGDSLCVTAGAIIGSGNRPECHSEKAVLDDGETNQGGADKTGRAVFVGFAIMFFANRFLSFLEAITNALRPAPLHCQALSPFLPAAFLPKTQPADSKAQDQPELSDPRRPRYLLRWFARMSRP